MKRLSSYLMLGVVGALLLFSCNKDPYTYATIETDFGNMKMMLYNSTPLHKENFIKLVNEGFYNDLLFHRVMPGFMAQGGDPDSKNAAPGARLGMGSPGYTLPAEIGAPHIRGAVSAARQPDNINPQKESNGSQYFIVQGGLQTDEVLTRLERQKNIKYNDAQKELYKTKGGYPSLDGDYTVFGEIIEGLEVIDSISVVQRDNANRPTRDLRMNIKILN